MIATFKPCKLSGMIDAPPSKSMAHRYLIGAALAKDVSVLSGIDYSEDILASMDCLRALGAKITVNGNQVSVDPCGFMQVDSPILECRESGSTLRFFIPLALCMGKPVTLRGSQRLFERPLGVYEDLCAEQGFLFQKDENSVTLCGNLKSGTYQVRGDVSSQFITGLILALLHLNQEAFIEISSRMESRSYIELTISALKSFGADVEFVEDNKIRIGESNFHSYCGKIEGDYSNAAFLDAFNYLESQVSVGNLNANSMQGDRVYQEYFEKISEGIPTLDISDCPDLGPILFALASMKQGAKFTGTERLKAKESDRGMAMHEELQKLGGGLLLGDNTITVPKQELQYKGEILSGHNDHRIVMAMSVILSQIGGSIEGVEAVRKSYPGFFEDLKQLGAIIDIRNEGERKN